MKRVAIHKCFCLLIQPAKGLQGASPLLTSVLWVPSGSKEEGKLPPVAFPTSPPPFITSAEESTTGAGVARLTVRETEAKSSLQKSKQEARQAGTAEDGSVPEAGNQNGSPPQGRSLALGDSLGSPP